MHYVYAIRSKVNGRIYVGQTKSIDERLAAHNEGRVKSTKSDRPWELIAVQMVGNRAEARWIERKLKLSHGARLRWIKCYRIK